MGEIVALPSECPACGTVAVREPYDIGDGPEYSCANCEWCWGAQGQDLSTVPPTLREAAEAEDAPESLRRAVEALERYDGGGSGG